MTNTTLSTSKQMKLVEKLIPQVFKKIGYSLKVIPTHGTYDFDALVKEALWIATSEHKSEEDIVHAAGSLMVKWVKEDIEPQIAEQLRQRAKRPLHPSNDPFSLPWGERIPEATIKSGEKGPLAVAIEPITTDKELLEEDAAKYLLKIFNYIVEWWGPHALVWFVLLNEFNFKDTMKFLKNDVDGTLTKQATRHIPRIKKDIQAHFSTTRI